MFKVHSIGDWRLLVVRYSEPFSGSDIVEVARVLAAPGQGVGEHMCLLVDLRAVDVSKLTASDSQRSVSVRKMRIEGRPAEPLAFLLRDMREQGSVRMHSQWAEALGLRDEQDTFSTTHLRAALDWIEKRTAQRGLADALESSL